MMIDNNFAGDINLGSNELVPGFNQPTGRCCERIAGSKLKRRYNLLAPRGVNGRNTDNTLIQEIFTGRLPHNCGAKRNKYRTDI
jgi:GDP-D-mannose 3', 5'-epimerase